MVLPAVCRTTGPMVASTGRGSPPLPADGVAPSLGPWRSSPASPPAEILSVTIAPVPSTARSFRRRILDRGRDQAVQERAVLVLHDVMKQYPNGKVALR